MRVSGLYDPAFEHDACGLGFVARLGGKPRHDVVEQGLEILRRLAHRGAAGSDPETGDGAGILIQIPHAFFERQLAHHDVEIPLVGDYGVAQVFLSRDPQRRAAQRAICEEAVRALNQKVIAWRDVPVDPSALGPVGRASMPHISQLFIGRVAPVHAFERSLFTIRKRAGKRVRDAFPNHPEFYIASLSSKTIVYKGLALPERLDAFYLDLKGDELKSKLALVHSRFSTNTFPTWERAHPFRRIAHNGEINTLRGNRGWMAAREAMLESKTFAEHLPDFLPIIRPDGSGLGIARQRRRFSRGRRTVASPRHDDARSRKRGRHIRGRLNDEVKRGFLRVPRSRLSSRGMVQRLSSSRTDRSSAARSIEMDCDPVVIS